MTRDEILALSPGREFDILVAEARGYQWWNLHGLSFLWAPECEKWLPKLEYTKGRLVDSVEVYQGRDFTKDTLEGVKTCEWLSCEYGGATVLFIAEGGCQVACKGISSGVGLLPLVASQMVLLLAECDKQEAASPKVEEMTNG